jgi:hypothetical protein
MSLLSFFVSSPMLPKKLEQVSPDLSALPDEVPKPAVTAMMTDNDSAILLDRRLKRIEEMKANAIEATSVIEGEEADARLPPVVPDRR